MNKLLAKKKQVPLATAAKYLSDILAEEVTEADILYHGLDGSLQLSVFFVNGVNSHQCELTPKTAPPLTYVESLGVRRDHFNDNMFADINLYSCAVLRGIYELSLTGTSYKYLKDVYQKLIGGPRVQFNQNESAIVQNKSSYYQLCEWPSEEEYDPSQLDIVPFPEDSQIVVRPSELKKLINLLNEPQKPKPRHDAMSVEIEKVIRELKAEGSEVNPSHVWHKLSERCGREGSCCAAWEHKGSEIHDKPVIMWFGIGGNQKELTFTALKERLRRKTR